MDILIRIVTMLGSGIMIVAGILLPIYHLMTTQISNILGF